MEFVLGFFLALVTVIVVSAVSTSAEKWTVKLLERARSFVVCVVRCAEKGL